MNKIKKLSLIKIAVKTIDSKFEKVQLKNSLQAIDIFRELIGDSMEIYESMYAIYVDSHLNTIGYAKISQGGVAKTVIDLKLTLKYGIELLAHGIIICHNHPSGSTKASDSDKEITAALREACKFVEITLYDSLIVTKNDCSQII